MKKLTLVRLAAAFAVTMVAPAALADAILSGVIKLPSGDTMGGVMVSAKADGATITTTVFTDASGAYYFPPLPNGTYRVWAQALTFETARAQVALDCQWPSGFHAATAREFREAIARPRTARRPCRKHAGRCTHESLVRKNCTGCHSASYVLQHRFDEDGWRKVLATMKNINGARRLPARRQARAQSRARCQCRTRLPPISPAHVARAKAR